MSAAGPKRGLGRGLQALIPAAGDVGSLPATQVVELPVAQIEPNSYQPRRHFDEDALDELAQSIRSHGVIQPVVVRLLEQGRYELVAGERRWRACRKLGLQTIPALIKDLTDRDVTQIALIENVQRSDLNPLEESWAYRTLLEEFGMTQDQLSQQVGKSRPYISNSLRLLNLPSVIQEWVQQGLMSAGHARALLGLPDEQSMIQLGREAIRQQWSVRKLEETVRRRLDRPMRENGDVSQGASQPHPPELREVVERLQRHLGTRVRLSGTEAKGLLQIEYYSAQDLTRIIDVVFGSDALPANL